MSYGPRETPIFVGRNKCPICSRMEILCTWVPLYGVRVCWPCSRAFTGLRELAFLIDILLFLLVVLALSIILSNVLPGSPYSSKVVIVAYLGSCLLFACKDGLAGMSLGKLLIGLQVVDAETGRPAGPVKSFLRNLCVSIPLVSWFYMWAVASQLAEGPRCGDGLAGTRVIWRRHRYALPFAVSATVCWACGYELRGNVSGRCPECGRTISPEMMRRINQEMESQQDWIDVSQAP